MKVSLIHRADNGKFRVCLDLEIPIFNQDHSWYSPDLTKDELSQLGATINYVLQHTDLCTADVTKKEAK